MRFDAELRRSKDSRLPASERGQALWTAAQIERRLGMELFGYEVAPDFTMCGGAFELGSMSKLRRQALWHPAWAGPPDTPEKVRFETPVLPATADELWCAAHYGPRHEQRFHYRYTAAELAWRAARFMPNDNPATARVLAIAGGWLKNRDPQSADRFYQALVRRNPSVPLAQEAEQKRWFPLEKWRFDLRLE